MENPPLVRDGDTGTVTLRVKFLEPPGSTRAVVLGSLQTWWPIDSPEIAAVTVDPRTPKHWPPTVGELWIDHHGCTVFCQDDGRFALEDGSHRDANWAASEPHKWTRVYPPEAQP